MADKIMETRTHNPCMEQYKGKKRRWKYNLNKLLTLQTHMDRISILGEYNIID